MPIHKYVPLEMLIAVLLLQCCGPQNKGFTTITYVPHYSVTISEDNVREVGVEALLPLHNDTLYMSQSDFSPLSDGYATFVNDLKAIDNKGNTVSLVSIGKGVWKVDVPLPCTIKLIYNVSIEHDTVQWAVSAAFARAYALDHVLFFAGRTLFIAPQGVDTSKIKVHFNLPKGWDIATPYAVSQDDQGTFQAENLDQLWRNGNFIGRIVKEEINVGDLEVIVAGMPSMREGVDLIKNALTKIVNSYKSEMGGAPAGKLVIMGSVSSLQQGGETFKNSISLMFFRAPDMYDKGQWGYLLAHEVFHLWNGSAIAPADQPQVEWFVEGFTEYMSKLTAYRTGFTSEAEFLQQLAYCRSDYLRLAGKISLVDAGVEKGVNYSLIYNGGMAAAFALDIEVRTKTNNKKGLIDIMRKMYSKFGETSIPYRYDDIIAVSSETAGADLSGFFSSYVAGLQVMPIDKYLGYAGLEADVLSGETIIRPKRDGGGIFIP
jgi:predicted metalloprotease with PDZ domain